jgi:YidC/Oxa1 family membrane protein insertase
MEKRFLLAVILSFVVLYGYQLLFPPAKPETPDAAAQNAGAPVQPGSPTTTTQAPPPAAEAPAAQAAVTSDTSERDIVVENRDVRAVFTNRGATLKNWTLKRYNNASGTPLDLVPQTVRGAPRPFTLLVDDAAVTATLQNALYRANTNGLTIGSSDATLTFDYESTDGLKAHKEFRFPAASPYVVHFTVQLTRKDAPLIPSVQWGPALGTGIVESSGGTYSPPPQPIFYRDGSVTRVKAGDIQKQPVEEGTFGFVGVDDHYFLAAAVPPPQGMHVEYLPVSVPVEGSKTGANFVSWSARYSSMPAGVRYFVGPKDFDVLKSVDVNLVRAIDFGMFAWLVVPLLRALKWVNGYVGNYGWSIITLTVLINLAMFPLRHKSVVSMRKMQEIQPEVKAIQDRYAKLKMSDPARQKMNVELMNLYRERGVNPASGCIPMLLTLPVLFAFYAMLSVAIELRGAPFVGWIHDLSRHDPLFVTPVIMGATMLIQQRMTPSTADPMQQKMMMFMPLVFMFMFVWAPSGLVLYWTASNLWQIGQQAITNRLIGPSRPRPARPPVEGPIKSAGGGRTDRAAKERK